MAFDNLEWIKLWMFSVLVQMWKELTACVLLDMSKAFDSVDHQILLRKLQDVGTSTSALQWFNSYLTIRYQVVWIHSSVSDPIPVEYEVPQGSILGPLFSIYVNDLPEAPRNCSTEWYVDDTKLFVSFHSQNTQRIVEEMNGDFLGVSLLTGSQRGRKKIRRASEWESERRDSASEASGTRGSL